MYDPFKLLQKNLNQLVNKEITKLLIIPVVKLNILKLNIRVPLEVSIVEFNNSFNIVVDQVRRAYL